MRRPPARSRPRTARCRPPQVLPHLHFDDDEVFRPDALDTMEGAQRDVDRSSREEPNDLLAARHHSFPANDLPMLRPPPMPLEAQAAPWPNDELASPVPGLLAQDQVISPGTIAPLHYQSALRNERMLYAISLLCVCLKSVYLPYCLDSCEVFFSPARSVALYGFSAEVELQLLLAVLRPFLQLYAAPSMVKRSS